MNHSHRHSAHYPHTHGGGGEHGANEIRVGIAALLTCLLMVGEAAGGFISGSLALLADAGHMLADCASLALAWLAFRLGRRPADGRRTYGFDRFSVLVAFVNGLALFFIAGWIAFEAFRRLREPTAVLGGPMLWIATAGLIVNLFVLWVLHGGSDRLNLNMRAAIVHVVGDLLGSAGTIGAALIILLTGMTAADPILSVLVALIILRSAWSIVSESGHILLEAAPLGLDIADVKADLEAAVPGVEDIHHLHAWCITEERPMITLHAKVSDNTAPETMVRMIKQRLQERFGIDHATVEIERGDCYDRAGAVRAR